MFPYSLLEMFKRKERALVEVPAGGGGKVYDAIMRAADTVERTDRYNFFRTVVPDRGQPGCILGLIGENLGVPAGASITDVAQRLGYQGDYIFYRAVDVALLQVTRGYFNNWTRDKRNAAAAMRRLALNYKEAA